MIPRVGGGASGGSGRENMIPPPHTPKVPSTPTNHGYHSIGSSSKATNRRTSIGGDEISSRNGSAARNRRLSLAPSMHESGYNNGSSTGNGHQKAADPRPITDKAFQQTCIHELLSFLHENTYPYPVTARCLTRPSAKDFTNVVTFMLRKVDTDFQRDVAGLKFEDEVVLNFKGLGYPFPISKTALVAAGSLHTWPALLAALHWLMQHLQCLQQARDIDYLDATSCPTWDTLDELQKQGDAAFYQYLQQAYTAYLCGDRMAQERVEAALHQKFENDDSLLHGYVEQLKENCTSLALDLEEYGEQHKAYV
jgi:kinetochore protein NDC80